MNNLQEKREAAKRELELKRIQAAVELELKRIQAKEDAKVKKEEYKNELNEKRAVADIRIDVDVFNQIVAEFQEKHAAVIDLMVLDNAVCVFSLKRS